MKIEIEKRNASELISPRGLSSYQVSIILLIVYYSTSGRSKYIYLDKLHCLFDLALCKRNVANLPKFTLPTWSIDRELKNKIIILVQNGILLQDQDNNKKVRYSLSNNGGELVNKIISIEQFENIRNFVENISNNLPTSDFEKSRVIL
ncbi:hypothetical protein [Aeromonas allosaccharophila]